jgi:hypothetical protein
VSFWIDFSISMKNDIGIYGNCIEPVDCIQGFADPEGVSLKFDPPVSIS